MRSDTPLESPLPPIERGGKGGLFRTGESSEELIEKMLKREDDLNLLWQARD